MRGQIRGEMLGSAWPSLLGTLSLLLSKSSGAVTTGLCVDCLVSLICSCASVGPSCDLSRDAMVNELIKVREREREGEVM